MKLKVIMALALFLPLSLVSNAQLASPFSNSVWPAQTFTATAQTGATIQLNGLVVSSTVGSSFASGTLTVTGTSLTTVTFSVMGSSDNGATFYALPIYTQASPTTTPTATITATANGIYQVSLAGLTHVKFVTSGTFTATAVSIVLTASPNAGIAKSGGGGLPGVSVSGSPSAGQVLTATSPSAADWQTPSGGSQRVVYTSTLLGTFGDAIVAPGSTTTGTDHAAALNAALSGGNVRLVVDGQYGLSTSLVVSSNTAVECLPGMGFIMQPASNLPMFVNAHPNAPTTSNGASGYLPSNITDNYIAFRGCIFNFNSTQAVTGTDPLYGTAHHVSAITGKWVFGFQFLGVSHLDISNNETYDSGAYSVGISNVEWVNFSNNLVHEPLPLVAFKNTDGFHIVGPGQFIYVNNNHLNAGDDSIALNADDGNNPAAGDPNGTYANFTGWKWGTITDAHMTGNTLDYALSGIRLFSGFSPMDRIYINDTSGSTQTGSLNIANYPPLGAGVMHHVTVDNWDVQPDGSNTEGATAVISVSSNIDSLSVCGLHYIHPLVNWPIIGISSTVGILRACNWEVDTTSSSFSSAIATGGTVSNFALDGISWLDNTSGTAPFVSGSSVPGVITVSNYAGPGPSRLLATGYAPAIENGDAFTNTYPSGPVYGTIYAQTSFAEASGGTLLAGTAPATCANGCTGSWTQAAGGPSSGAWAYGSGSASVSGNCSAGGPDDYCPVYINAGTPNYTLRANVTAMNSAGNLAFVVRWTDYSNFVAVLNLGGGGWGVCDVVAGTTTCSTTTTLGIPTGLYTIVVNGTSVSLTNSGGTLTRTISSSNTSNNVGVNSAVASGTGTVTLSSLIVSSQ